MKTGKQDPVGEQSMRKWIIVMCGFFLSFLTDGVRFSFGLTYKELLAEFVKGKGATASTGSLMFATMNFSAPLASVLINKYSCRFTAMLGSVIYCVGLIATSLTHNFYVLYFSFGIICGIGNSFMYVPISVSILQYFDDKKSLANGIAMSGSGIGGFVFNPLLNTLIYIYAWRGALQVTAGLVLQGAVAGCLMRPKCETFIKSSEDKRKSQTDFAQETSLNEILQKKIPEKPTRNKDSFDNFGKKKHYNSDSTLWVKSPHVTQIYEKTVSQSNFKLEQETSMLYTEMDDSYLIDADLCYEDQTEMRNHDAAMSSSETQNIQYDGGILNTEKSQTNQIINDDKMLRKPNKSPNKTMKSLFAWYILKDPKFIYFMLSQFFLAIAYMIPFTYLPEVVISLGYSRSKAVWLMSSVSIVSTVSRAASGWLADRGFINRRILYCVAHFTCAAAVLSLFLWQQYECILIASLLFAVTTGCIIATIAVMVYDLFGFRLMSDAYGLSIFARSPGNLSGPSFSGWLVDRTGRPELVFVVSGLAFALAGVSITLSIRAKDRLKGIHANG